MINTHSRNRRSVSNSDRTLVNSATLPKPRSEPERRPPSPLGHCRHRFHLASRVTSSRQIARPRPVPPNLRVVDESTCSNALEQRAALRSSGNSDTGIAQPRCAARLRHPESSCSSTSGCACTLTLPSLSELERVVQQIDENLTQARRVARECATEPLAATIACQLETFGFGDAGERISTALSTTCPQIELDHLEIELPGLDFGKVEDVIDQTPSSASAALLAVRAKV